MAKSKTYLTRDIQSVYDLAVQLYGDVSKIGILMELFPNLDSLIELNSPIVVEDQLDPIAIYFRDTGLIVATDKINDHFIYRITEVGDYRITENGDREY